MFRIAALTIGLLAATPLGTANAEETVCPEGTHAIYTAEEVLVSCEEIVGAPAACPEDAEPGYLEDGTLAGCFTGALDVEELCTPVGVDTDGDMLDDGCDPCPTEADCDGDGFCDGLEMYLGTNPLDNCTDEAGVHDAWPLDMNMDRNVTIVGDVLNYADRVGLSVNGDLTLQRLDLNGDGAITVVGDALMYAGMIGAGCDDAGVAGVLAGGMCFACIEWPVGTLDLHAYGEFNWTIPIPWPWPDIVTTKYRMNLRVSFIWINMFNIVGITYSHAWAEAWFPYSIGGDPTVWTTSDGPGQRTVTAMTGVDVIPGIGVTYPIYLWIDFWMPGYWGGGGFGFHDWWIHQN